MLDFMNNNPGLVAILGVVIGWGLSLLSGHFSYQRQKNDELEKEKRERFLYKAELNPNEWYRVDIENTRVLEVVLCTYDACLDEEGNVVYKFPKGIASVESLGKHVCIFENTGESDINDLEVGTLDAKTTALLPLSRFEDCVENGKIWYRALLNGRVRRGEALELIVYYPKDDFKKIGSELAVLVYYRDSRNNNCVQTLSLSGEGQASEPILTTRKEWKEQVGTENNDSYWSDRLREKALWSKTKKR